jgi:hypothetical protein
MRHEEVYVTGFHWNQMSKLLKTSIFIENKRRNILATMEKG